MRRRGLVPGSVYGMNRPAFCVAVRRRSVDDVLRLGTGRNTILTLLLAGAKDRRDVMFKELQRDPVTEDLIHVDFVRVDPNKSVQVHVPVQLVGLAEGVKNEGGILDFVHRQIHVSCLPESIPEHLDVDVSELHINQHVSVGDVQFPEAVEVLDDPGAIVAVVAVSKAEVAAVEEEEEVAEAEEGEEPEVIKKGKESEEGETATEKKESS